MDMVNVLSSNLNNLKDAKIPNFQQNIPDNSDNMMKEINRLLINKINPTPNANNNFRPNNLNSNVNSYSNIHQINQINPNYVFNNTSSPIQEQDKIINYEHPNNVYDNKAAKEKFYALKGTINIFLNLEKNNKRFFQVVYMFKNKIKRMYRIDCMTRKINVNFYHYIKENFRKLNINDELLEFFKNNIRYTSRTKFQEIDKKYPSFKKIYEDYLKSDKFKKLILNIKNKYDEEYLKLFFRHSKNFLNFYLKDNGPNEEDKEERENDDIDMEEIENLPKEDMDYESEEDSEFNEEIEEMDT